MTVRIEVNNIYCKILDKLSIDQLAIIQEECSFKMEGSDFKALSFKKKGIEWDGVKKLFNIQTRRFPIGLLHRVKELFNRYGIHVEIINKRLINDTDYNFNMISERNPRPYQVQAVLSSVINGNGIIKVATGGGKTFIAGLTIDAIKKKTIFIVHTKDLLYQTKNSFSEMFPDETIGQIGDGIIDYQNITVATMQTLAILGSLEFNKSKYDEDNVDDEEKIIADKEKMIKFAEYKITVQCVMMDEVQIVCSQTAQSVRFLFEYANYAFGYSASPWRDDGSDLAIEAAFGNRIVDIDASSLIRQGFLVKPTILIKKCFYPVFPSDEKLDYVKTYKKYIVENDIRNHSIANDAWGQYCNGKNTLILVTQIKHGKAIQEIFKKFNQEIPPFISGKSSKNIRKNTIEAMRNGKIQLMIASTIADVGLDIPILDCIVEAGSGKSSVTALQRLGRIMRIYKDKKECLFITYHDKGVKFIDSHTYKKIEIWKTEPEFIILRED